MEDYLETAKHILLTERKIPTVVENEHVFSVLLAIGHALVALCERIDDVTGYPVNQAVKAVRVSTKK